MNPYQMYKAAGIQEMKPHLKSLVNLVTPSLEARAAESLANAGENREKLERILEGAREARRKGNQLAQPAPAPEPDHALPLLAGGALAAGGFFAAKAMNEKEAGLLRAKFLSGQPMAPHEAKQWEAVTQRFAQRQLKREGTPFARSDGRHDVAAKLSQSDQGKVMNLRVEPRVEGHGSVGLSQFSVRNQHGQGVTGRTFSQDIYPAFQRKGFGSRTARAMDAVMEAMGSRSLHTMIENKAHVTPYRTAMGYEPRAGSEHVKDVMTTPAIHRDRQRFATPGIERRISPVPGTGGRRAQVHEIPAAGGVPVLR